jgi:predicted  nucleic acid-binding Zn-ribbon protein
MKTEKESYQIPNARRAEIFWPIAIVVVAAGVGIAWWCFPYLSSKLGKSTTPVVEVSAPTESDYFGPRIKALEERLIDWSKDKAGMTDRIAQLEKSMGAGIRRARSETTALVEGVKRDLAQGMAAVQTKLTGIESAQNETHEQVARLQQDVAAAQRDLVAAREANAQLANQVAQMEQSQNSTQGQVSRLQNRMLESDNRVDALSYTVERRRVDFELKRDRAEEIISGIHLTVTRTDVARQKIDGWVQVAGRIVWLHDENAQQPIALASVGEERPYQLVFTRVADNSATGYMLVPSAPGAPVNTASR